MTSERLAVVPPADLTDEQRRLHAEITGGKRGQARRTVSLTDEQGALLGPFNAMLRQPRLGFALQALGSAIRYETSISDRSREIAILVVAAHWSSDYESAVHGEIARSLGIDDDALTAITSGGPWNGSDAHERIVFESTLALVRRGDLTESEYASAFSALGETGLFELLTLVGYYAALALQLRVFRVHPTHTIQSAEQ